MKYIKLFEDKDDNDLELLTDLIDENPLSKTHDFYIFIAGDKFEETKNGLYKKNLNIENMVRITPDKKSLGAMKGLQLRANFQHDSRLYHIWLPQEIRDDVEGKGTNSLEPWLVELINKHKRIGDKDGEGKRVLKDVLRRREDVNKYNL
jgi:hypothetical protein